jgi:hypothetical protein
LRRRDWAHWVNPTRSSPWHRPLRRCNRATRVVSTRSWAKSGRPRALDRATFWVSSSRSRTRSQVAARVHDGAIGNVSTRSHSRAFGAAWADGIARVVAAGNRLRSRSLGLTHRLGRLVAAGSRGWGWLCGFAAWLGRLSAWFRGSGWLSRGVAWRRLRRGRARGRRRSFRNWRRQLREERLGTHRSEDRGSDAESERA